MPSTPKFFALIDGTNPSKPARGITYIAIGEQAGKYKRVHDVFTDGNYLMRAANVIESAIEVPGGLRVIMGECGELNALYVPSRRAVVICHELVAHFADHFRAKYTQNPERIGPAVVNATIFAFFHELGHAFFHIYDFPNLGSEEDAADRIAAMLLLEQGEAAAERTLEGAEGLLALAKLGAAPHWDVHGFGEQRFFNVACLVLGALGPNARLVGQDDFNKNRAPTCSKEHAQAARSLDRFLAPFYRKAKAKSRLEALLEPIPTKR